MLTVHIYLLATIIYVTLADFSFHMIEHATEDKKKRGRIANNSYSYSYILLHSIYCYTHGWIHSNAIPPTNVKMKEKTPRNYSKWYMTRRDTIAVIIIMQFCYSSPLLYDTVFLDKKTQSKRTIILRASAKYMSNEHSGDNFSLRFQGCVVKSFRINTICCEQHLFTVTVIVAVVVFCSIG